MAKIRFDENGPMDAYTELLEFATIAALVRGRERGATWKEFTDPDGDPLDNARHVIDIHAQCRIAESLEKLEYGDVDGFIAKLGSAVGYLAVAVLKAVYLTEESDG
jgi:hypothetical protein